MTHASWQPEAGCVPQVTASGVLKPFISTIIFDTIVLALTAYKLLGPNRGGSKLVNLLFKDGLVYFTIVLVPDLQVIVMNYAESDALVHCTVSWPVFLLPFCHPYSLIQ